MTNKLGLICMGFDGKYITEKRAEFETIKLAWRHAEDMGSRWVFYPFCFVVTESGKSIKDSPYGLKYMNGKRVATIKRFFNEVSKMEDMQGVDAEVYWMKLRDMNDYFEVFYC